MWPNSTEAVCISVKLSIDKNWVVRIGARSSCSIIPCPAGLLVECELGFRVGNFSEVLFPKSKLHHHLDHDVIFSWEREFKNKKRKRERDSEF